VNKKIRLIFLAVGLVFFIYLISDLGIHNIVKNLGKTGWWFVPIIGLWGIVYLLNSIAWRVIIGDPGSRIGWGEIIKVTLSSFAINYVTPVIGLGGEPYRVLAIKEKVGVGQAVSSVFLYRLIHASAHLLFLLAAVLVAILFIPLSSQLRFYLILISALLTALIYFILSAQKYRIFSNGIRLLRKIHFLNGLSSMLNGHDGTALEIDGKIAELYETRKGAFFLAFTLEFVSRVIIAFEFYFILNAIDIKIAIIDTFYISAATSFVLNFLFFVPFELGTREGSLYLIMESLNLSPEIGIYIGLVNRIRELFWIFVGLGLVYISGRAIRPPESAGIKEKEPIPIAEERT
jgi:uncharacterized membrane protein YbhN (UPF0104 family)